MHQLSIDERAIENYLASSGSLIQNQIESYYNPDFLVEVGPFLYSFLFSKSEVIIITIDNQRIVNFQCETYQNLITDVFLEELLNLDCLPARIKRYSKLSCDRLRREIADELRLGAIKVENNNPIWGDYHLKFKISSSLNFRINL